MTQTGVRLLDDRRWRAIAAAVTVLVTLGGVGVGVYWRVTTYFAQFATTNDLAAVKKELTDATEKVGDRVDYAISEIRLNHLRSRRASIEGRIRILEDTQRRSAYEAENLRDLRRELRDLEKEIDMHVDEQRQMPGAR